MEAIGRLAGGVAHDFNNVITVVSGYGHMLLEGVQDDPALREAAEEVLRSADRAAGLASQLLAFSRRQIIQPRVLDLNSLVANMERMLGRVIGEDIELKTVLRAEVGKVRADPGQLEQVVMNLAVNARDAMPHGGKLTIETANTMLDDTYMGTHSGVRPGPYAMLAVSDNGTGMDPETRAHLFEPFYTTKEKGKGTGLGLSTVYGIVKQHGGDIWVYSERGRGTTFKIYLPMVGERVEGPEKAAPPPARHGTEQILLVEDEDGVRRLVREILEQRGYKVIEASSGEQALEVLERDHQNLGLLLTDVVMPKMSGRDLAEAAALLSPDLRVLFLSGYTDQVVVDHGVVVGADFLQKPFTPETLAHKVREVLDRPVRRGNLRE
jgi:CheY-like chemotaxis protein